MRTSVEGIYGAGDVAENTDKVSGGYVSSYIWPNAMAQGKCAAYNMSGQEQEISYSDRMQNMVQMRDMPFMSMGLISPGSREYEVLVSYDDKIGFYKKLVIKDNVIKGMIFIGDISNANSISSCIRKGTDITSSRQAILDSIFQNKYSCLDE
jgi:nitrite reductase (NADH) large subunit